MREEELEEIEALEERVLEVEKNLGNQDGKIPVLISKNGAHIAKQA